MLITTKVAYQISFRSLKRALERQDKDTTML
jgi:hypothetical protein